MSQTYVCKKGEKKRTSPCSHIVRIVVLPWDAACLVDRVERKSTDSIALRHPPLTGMPRLDDVCTVVDEHGRILVWSLPSVLSERRQVRLQANFP